MKCLVTGANGFIGSHLVRYLLAAGHAVRAVSSSEAALARVRENMGGARLETAWVARGETNSAAWRAACRDAEAVFHLAGRAHRVSNASASARVAYFRDNLETTRALAQSAREMGVRRFVFASSVTVYGMASEPGEPFREDSPIVPHPGDFYAQSKRAAEAFLLSDCACADMEAVVVRLPLIYGAGVKGNMAALMRLAASGLPLPLAGIRNSRSFLNIPNCVDFLLAAATHPHAGGQILLASDQEDISTPELIRAMARALGKPARVFPVPAHVLKLACLLLGQKARFEKLAGHFQIDPAASCALLGWQPKVRLAEGIAQMCAGCGEA